MTIGRFCFKLSRNFAKTASVLGSKVRGVLKALTEVTVAQKPPSNWPLLGFQCPVSLRRLLSILFRSVNRIEARFPEQT